MTCSRLLALVFVALGPVTSLAGAPTALWVAPLEGGRTVDTAWEAGVEVRDLFPDALVVVDAGSADALAAAGFRVSGPHPLRPGRTVMLLRPRDEERVEAGVDVAAIAALPGVDVVWAEGADVIVEVDSVLPPVEPVLRLGKKRLSALPVRRPIVAARQEGPAARATAFNPAIDEIVARVDSTVYFPWIEYLAGAEPVEVGGQPVTFATRYTFAPQCDTAEQFVYESFLAMGFTDVEYDPFTLSGHTARNVVATLPGLETPERIYILCGHLDSTSPNPYGSAPGANDNASGTAAVLAGAEILKDYSFRSTIKFIAFTGEEQGLVGSTHYAAQAAAAGDSILGVVNCDMIAFYETEYGIDIEGRTWCDDFMQVMNDACATYTGLATTVKYFAWGSDHVPFLQRGYPAFLAIEADFGPYPCYHRECDTAEINHGTFGADVTRACLATIAQLAELTGPTTVLPSGGGAIVALDSRPNPFADDTTIRFSLDSPELAELAIYDVSGRRIRTLVRGVLGAGSHERTWDGRTDAGVASPAGVYFSRLTVGAASISEKMVRLR